MLNKIEDYIENVLYNHEERLKIGALTDNKTALVADALSENISLFAEVLEEELLECISIKDSENSKTNFTQLYI